MRPAPRIREIGAFEAKTNLSTSQDIPEPPTDAAGG